MDSVDPSAFLDDMTFQWQEPPFCTLADDIENFNPQNIHSNLMDSILFDRIMELPDIATIIPESSSPFPTITESDVNGSWSANLWPCEIAPPIVSDIVQVGGTNEKMVNFPLVVQEGDTFDGCIVEASCEPKSPQLASAPFTSPVVKQKSRRATKKQPKSKSTAPKVTSAIELENAAEQVKEIRVNITHEEHIRRERHRRDEISAKYLVLESMLPPAPKRERAVVVEDATLLVRALQQKKAQLLKRRAELKTVEAPNSQNSQRRPKHIWPSSQKNHDPTGMGACITQQITESPVPLITAAAENITAPKAPDSSLSSNSEESLEGTAMNTISVYARVEDMVVEMMWNQPPPYFESSLLHAVESLGSEVTRCSIVRVTSEVAQCFIACSKPQVSSQLSLEMQSMASEILITGALREVLARSR